MLKEYQYYTLNGKVFFIICDPTFGDDDEIVLVRDLNKQIIPKSLKQRIIDNARPISFPIIHNIKIPDFNKSITTRSIEFGKYYYVPQINHIIFNLGETNIVGDSLVRFAFNLAKYKLLDLRGYSYFELPPPTMPVPYRV